jgi:hypothetical protein
MLASCCHDNTLDRLQSLLHVPGISTMQTFKSYQMMYCTWCHRKPTTWYLHHANLQILSDDVLYMVSLQAYYLVFPPCKPSNLTRCCTVHGVTSSLLLGISTMQTFKSYQMMYCTWCHHKPTTWYLHHANLQILSDDVLYMVSPQTVHLVLPPCKPSVFPYTGIPLY